MVPHDEIIRNQAAYRRRLADFWKIPTGAAVLEIGCGQGDMTAVLAETAGSVVAVDRAGRDYGAPMTLGDATDQLRRDNVEFWFEFDLLDPPAKFGSRQFDVAVLAHSPWYFDSLTTLQDTLQALSSRAGCLCLAEWDLTPTRSDHIAHWLAVRLQEQIENFKPLSQANIRLPLPRAAMASLVEAAGWSIHREATIDTTGLQDTDWEIQHCLRVHPLEVETLDIPQRVRETLRRELDWLEKIALPSANPTLDAFAVTARSRRL